MEQILTDNLFEAETHFYEEESRSSQTDMMQTVSLFGKCFLSLQQIEMLNIIFTEKLKNLNFTCLKCVSSPFSTSPRALCLGGFLQMISQYDAPFQALVSLLSSLIFILLFSCFTCDGTKLAFVSARLIFFVVCLFILQSISCKNSDFQLHFLTKSHSNNFFLSLYV